MAVSNYLEIDPKPSLFANLIDSSEKIDDLDKDWFMKDSEAVISEIGDIFDMPSNVKKITPIPGMCVKTKTDKNEKVFINVCHHSVVPPPQQSMNIEEMIKSPEESLFHFPLSLGELRVEKDKSGNECMSFDSVINSDYYHHEVLKKSRIRDFILTLVLSRLEQKFNITIDNQSLKILTKPYHGKLVNQFIRLEPQANKNFLSLDENMFKGNNAIPDSELSILSNLNDSNVNNSELKRGRLAEDTKVTISEVDEYNKTKIGIGEICNLSHEAANESIEPNPGICAKTKTNKDEKVFINLCHHNALPHPPPSNNVEDILKSPKESFLGFPLSLGELRVEKDKSGNECKCFDVVINSDYYQHEVLKKSDLRDFILILASTGIERKYNINIDVGAIKILTKPYHGEMPGHFIRLLSEYQTGEHIPSLNESMSKNVIMPVQDLSRIIPFSPEIADYRLFQKPSSGKARLLIFQSFVSGISDKRDLAAFVSKHQLTVEDKKGNTLVKVPLNYTISPEKCVSNFWNKRLTVAMPVEEGDTN